jgi:hypothetical protein
MESENPKKQKVVLGDGRQKLKDKKYLFSVKQNSL